MALKDWNLEANEESGQQKELKTHFELVIRSETEEIALMKANGIKHLHPSLEIREVAE